jgi:hypothetical protein
VTLRVVSDLVVIILSSIALAASRPAFARWKSDVRQRARMISDPELEPFLQSRSVKTFRWAWFAIMASLLFIAVWDLMTQL